MQDYPGGTFINGEVGTGRDYYIYSYGLWLNENPGNSKIEFLRSEVEPTGRIRGFTELHGNRNLNFPNQTITLRYYKEDGFHGIYRYNGETGKIIGDVDLTVFYIGNNANIRAVGTLAKGLTMNGVDFKGIAVSNLSLGSKGFAEIASIDFGTISDIQSVTDFQFDDKVLHQEGQERVVFVLSQDGTAESFPSKIAGEIKIRGFKISNTDPAAFTNNLIGVFLGEKQEE